MKLQTTQIFLLTLVSQSSAFIHKSNKVVFGGFQQHQRLSVSQLHEANHNNTNNSAAPSSCKTFREAELLGLQYMQEGDYEMALQSFQRGLKLPGSRTDVLRTQTLSSSPVGGAAGGREGKVIQTLDEFEYQAAYYNIACAHAKLSQYPESVASLRKAFDFGFENLETVKVDPDLKVLKGQPEFEAFMREKKGGGLFGLFQ